MKKYYWIFLAAIALLVSGKQTEKRERPKGDQIAVSWGVVENMYNNKTQFLSKFVLKNKAEVALADDWVFYFNFIRSVELDASAPLQIEHVNGDLWKMQPTKGFRLEAGGTMEQTFVSGSWATSITDAPMGGFFVFSDSPKAPEKLLKDIQVLPFATVKQTKREERDIRPAETPRLRYEKHKRFGLKRLKVGSFQRIVPKPKTFSEGIGSFIMNKNTVVVADEQFRNEAEFLTTVLAKHLGVELTSSEENQQENAILLHYNKNVEGKEAYKLTVSKNRIRIEASDRAGAFYGIQSVRALLPLVSYKEEQAEIEIPVLKIEDEPRFPYRGMHLDVARNFQSKASVLKLLDLMALYKLNKFHLHFCDDEGWRIEIPTLPELTELGAYRAFPPEDKLALLPSFGSGPDRTGQAGSGFYTRDDFIEILKHATERHIEVIPEIDLPGHARAAIKAMDLRYERFMKQGKKQEAERFLLRDLNDKSKYRSVQGWTDNTVCVVSEGLYRFVGEVTWQLSAMYEAAGTKLETVHVGGDEVPAGVWEQSPLCQQFLKKNEAYETTRDLQAYFVRRFAKIMNPQNIKTAGWEEIAISSENGTHTPRAEFANTGMMPYVWNNKWGWGMEDLANKLANAGYPTVLCGVTNLYFDMAYTKDPNEPGYYWGAYTDTRKPYELTPLDVRHCSYEDMYGNPIDGHKLFEGKELLKPAAKKNILGIQGELWSENTKTDAMQEYMLFPKLLSLAERAWAQQPAWANVPGREVRLKALNKDWNSFANALGRQELPKLDFYYSGVGYRIPPPGAVLEQGMLRVSVEFPGLEIRYTTDGTEPTVESALYTTPIRVNGLIKLRTFTKNGRGSRVVEVTK